MHDILEHYGKTIITLFSIAAAITIAGFIVVKVATKTDSAVDDLGKNYQSQAISDVDGAMDDSE